MIRFQAGHRTALVCLLLALAVLAVYWPVRHYDFIDYDDDNYVFDNSAVRAGWSWGGIVWAFVDRQAVNWHPLTWLSHMTDCQWFGLNPGAHHLINVLFHCANSVLLLLLLNTLTGAFWRSAFVAAVFALHPLRVESVAWISERKDVLSGCCFMLTLWMYVLYAKARRASGPDRIRGRRGIFYTLSVFFFLLGLLSKPMVVTIPLVLLLLDCWPLQRLTFFKPNEPLPSGAGSISPEPCRSVFFEKWPYFLLSAVFGIITLWAQQNALPPQTLNLFPRVEGMVVAVLSYLEKLLWPRNLSFLYLRPEQFPPAQVLLALLVVSSISALAVLNLRRRTWLAVGWLWFLVMLLPVTVVILSRLFIADRYTYLSGIGFFLMVTWGIGDAAGALLSRRIRGVLATVSAAVILLICSVLTRQQLAYWQNTRTLMEHALKVDPNNHVARINLHIYLFELEHPDIRQPPPMANGAKSMR